MRFRLKVLLGLVSASAGGASAASASSSGAFKREVVQGAKRRAHIARKQMEVNDELLAKAIPVKEYEQKTGIKINMDDNNDADAGQTQQLLPQQQQLNRMLEDFEVDYEDMYSFSGYSLRYAKCQPVQYFSENAVLNGEYSPMVIEDIVVLRLCPQATCSDSSTYGCYYNYADYALTLNQYVKIMLRYTALIKEYVCEWCEECWNNNGENNENENENEDENQNNRRRKLEDGQQDGDEAEENQQQQYNDACNGYYSYCYTYQCDNEGGGNNNNNNNNNNGDGDGNNDDNYLDYEEYLDYIDCAEVNYNDYAYFVRPRCNGDDGTFKMEAYYDMYCIQYASDVNVKDLGLGIKEGIFEDYYSTTCIDCSESYYPPYFDASSTLCNKIHSISAKCTDDLMYDLFENEEDDSGECTFIESIRFGAYDESGNFASARYSSGSSWNAKVTIIQKAFLGVSIGVCVIFVISACYLHHSMTNLLIKSLSHRELLPPSRAGIRRSPMTKVRRVGSSKRSNKVDDEPDWDSGTREGA